MSGILSALRAIHNRRDVAEKPRDAIRALINEWIQHPSFVNLVEALIHLAIEFGDAVTFNAFDHLVNGNMPMPRRALPPYSYTLSAFLADEERIAVRHSEDAAWAALRDRLAP